MVIVEVENKEKQKTKKTKLVKPYTIRILPNDEGILQKRSHYFVDSKADKVIKCNNIERYFERLKKHIEKDGRKVPKILKINLEAHGSSDGNIFMGDEKATLNNNIYCILGLYIKYLLEKGVKKVYIKTSPCYGGCYINTHTKEGTKNIFEIIKNAIEGSCYKKVNGQYVKDSNGQLVRDEKLAEDLVDKVYCSTTRAGIGVWNKNRVHGHAKGFGQEKDVPWYKKSRFMLNQFLGIGYWTFLRWKPTRSVNWFRHMSESKRKSMGVSIGSEGKIYFPLKDAALFGYDNYFKNEKRKDLPEKYSREELNKEYSGPKAKELAYKFLQTVPKINNEKVKTSLRDKKRRVARFHVK